MSYLALYRRFRPQVFEDLIGQETVVRALVNQIKTDKIGHAYLFCGARGTGKTTAAKIFAKAINCQEKSGSPCGKCEVCQKLSDPNSLDIVEMDAASNNRVDNVREIRDKVQYPPVAGRYKVYIIDEVHMLTTEAFNALLKTLEEPPKHAVFILATTEPHKLPATILSRCMRFDFKLIPTATIADHIANIFNEVGKEFDREAVVAIARAGEGSVRDALSIADICLSYKTEKLTYNDVIEVLGASDRRKTALLAKSMFQNDTATALSVVDELSGLGKNTGMLIKDVLSFLRDVMVVKTCHKPENILALPKEDIAELKSLADIIDNHGLLRMLEIFSAIENDVKYSTHPRIIFETAVVKATTASADYNIDALLSRMAKLEEMVAKGISVQVKAQAVQAQQQQQEVKPQAVQPQAQVKIERPQAQEKPQEEVKPREVQEEKIVEKPEKPTNNPISSQRRQLSRSERIKAELSSLTVSVEEDIPPMDLFEEKKPENIEEVKQVETEAPKPVNAVPDRKIWGMLIRKLRETGNTMLWVICQELECTVENETVKIFVETDREYLSITKKDNLDKLKEILAMLTNYKLEIIQKGVTTDNTESELEKLKENFDKLEIID